ncbi:unnamed protein product [Jaminaea pallidilutea]
MAVEPGRSAAEPLKQSATLSIDDILADLATLTGQSPEKQASSSSSSSGTPEHPLLALGTSLDPASPKQTDREATSDAFVPSSADLELEPGSASLDKLFSSISSSTSSIEDHQALIRAFLAVTDRAVLSGQPSTTAAGSLVTTDSSTNAARIEALHRTVAKLQADMDQLQASLSRAGQNVGSKT